MCVHVRTTYCPTLAQKDLVYAYMYVNNCMT